jgi:hypothetical protein
MVKFRLERLTLLISIFLVFSGCGYKFISGGGKKVFLQSVLNSTLQSRIDLYLAGEIKKVFVEYPEFSPVNHEDAADYVLQVNIKKWERMPMFFSKEGRDEISIAKFYIETEVVVSRKKQKLFTDLISDVLAVSLVNAYDEEYILQKISKKLADKIYFYMLEKT